MSEEVGQTAKESEEGLLGYLQAACRDGGSG